jgi:hypothetical protein
MLGLEENNVHHGYSGIVTQDNLTPTCSPVTPDCGWFIRTESPGDDERSTQSPSPSLWLNYNSQSGQNDEPQSLDVRVVDLTTPERRAWHSYTTPASKSPLANHSRKANTSAPRNPAASTPGPAATNGIRRRPDEVQPNRTVIRPACDLRSITHVTTFLEKVLAGVDVKDFQPAFVARDIRVLERGYWQFLVQTSTRDRGEEPKPPPKPALRLLGSTARKQRDRAGAANKASTNATACAVWAEEDLVFMWDNVTKFLEQGMLGLDTWIAKDSTGETAWKIRLFAWGEILAHLWFVLYIFSNKLTGDLPMEWIAADGSVVVQMSPGKNMRGVWQRKGPVGARGSWTFA